MKQREVIETRLLLEPLDVLMFRSSRPFFRGEQNVAESGPVSPLTFAGAVKTKILLDYSPNPPREWWRKSEFREIAELIGSPEDGGKINLRCVAFSSLKNFEEYFPLPLDIVFSENDDSAMLLKPLEGKPFELDTGFYSLTSESFYVGTKPGYLSREGLFKYLQGDVPVENQRFFGASELYQYERRTGIALDKNKKTTEESMLYAADFFRLQHHVGFMVWLDEVDGFAKEGLLRLGGEGRGCICRKLEDWKPDISKITEEVNKSYRFKLYFATPTVFSRKDNETWWCPNIKILEKELGVELSLVSAASGKPLMLGGWDAARGKQKPLMKAVPAGTVYFFKLKEGNKLREDLEMPLQISDYGASSGFGSAFMGVW